VKWKSYPEYRKSNIELFDDVPHHWETRRLKNITVAKITDGPHATPEFLSEGVPFLSVDSIQNGELVFEKCRFVSENDHMQYKRKTFPTHGDILMGKAASTGKIARVKVNFEFSIWSPLALIKIDPKKADSHFIEFVLKSTQIQTQIEVRCNVNTQKNIAMDDIPLLIFETPPLDEQRAIAAFLDRETERIDALIAKKERQIELLQEKRAALISHTVTKGLNTNARMKDSGIEWLGKIPEGWQVRALKYVFKNLDHRRIPLSGEERSYMVKMYPYYGASGIIDYVDSFIFDEPLLLVAEDGANLLSRSTPLAFIANGKYWVNNHAHILKPINGNLQFWEGVLQTFDYTPLITGAAQPKLTADNLANIALPCPPPAKQDMIAAFLDQETSQIDLLIVKIEGSINKLCEYRVTLISAAVTGKIDVRKEVA